MIKTTECHKAEREFTALVRSVYLRRGMMHSLLGGRDENNGIDYL